MANKRSADEQNLSLSGQELSEYSRLAGPDPRPKPCGCALAGLAQAAGCTCVSCSGWLWLPVVFRLFLGWPAWAGGLVLAGVLFWPGLGWLV